MAGPEDFEDDKPQDAADLGRWDGDRSAFFTILEVPLIQANEK